MIASPPAPRQVFFDPHDYPQLEPVRAAFPAIQTEGVKVMNLLAHREFLYGDSLNTVGRGFTGTWARFYMHYCGMDIGVNRRICPRTTAVTDLLPGLVAAGFYLLGPEAHVEPHTGICQHIKRSHLGLVCPPDCALRIGNDVRHWREGELLVFDDTIEHEAWNRSDAVRVVLHLDFFDPPDQDPELRARTLRQLREINITVRDADHLWLAAGEIRTDEDLQRVLEASVARARSTTAGARQVDAINRLVASHGLFFA